MPGCKMFILNLHRRSNSIFVINSRQKYLSHLVNYALKTNVFHNQQICNVVEFSPTLHRKYHVSSFSSNQNQDSKKYYISIIKVTSRILYSDLEYFFAARSKTTIMVHKPKRSRLCCRDGFSRSFSAAHTLHEF